MTYKKISDWTPPSIVTALAAMTNTDDMEAYTPTELQ